jgi:hypothetical protein
MGVMDDFWGTVAAVPVSLAATVGAVGFLIKLPPVRWILRTLISDPVAGWFQREVHEDTIPLIKQELQFNGGESIKDAIRRIDRGLERLFEFRHDDMVLRDDRQHEVDQELRGFAGQLQAVDAKVDEIARKLPEPDPEEDGP